jgi:hypothetical protein
LGEPPKRALETRDRSSLLALAEKLRTHRKGIDHEQEDHNHIAGGDRHSGSVRRDGFSTAAEQERGTDRRV